MSRHHTLARLTGALLPALWALSAIAADVPPIKPGLWEMVNESQQLDGQPMPNYSAQMAEQLKNMPPQMRQQIEAQMKAQGIQMAPAAGGGAAVRMCLTQDMISRNEWQRSDGACLNQTVSRSGNTWRWKVSCTQPPGQGEGSTTFTSPEAYSGEVRMTTQHGGKPQTMTMKHRANWISSDCGGLKPVQPSAKPR